MRGDFAGRKSAKGASAYVRNLMRWGAAIVVGCATAGSATFGLLAATPADQSAAAADLFQAIESGDVEARVVARDPHHVRVFLKNKSMRPVSVKLPAVFAARPMLAQQNFFNPQQGGNQPGLFGSPSGGQQATQTVAGPGVGTARNGAIFNIAPETIRELRVDSVCLEHGKPDPRSSVPYELVKLDEVCADPAVESLLVRYGEAGLERDVVQAAAWNLANGLGWDELAKMSEPIAVNAVQRIYTAEQLQLARKLAEGATKEAAKKIAAAKKKSQPTVATKL